MTIEGGAVKPDDRVVTHNNLISPGYFKALSMKIVAGRDLDAPPDGNGARHSPGREFHDGHR